MKNVFIGVDKEYSLKVIGELNSLLAHYQVHYQNLRGLHWNIKGKNFFELHVKFEEYYGDSQLKIDVIAERILTLGGVPLHTFTDYLSVSEIEVGKNISNDVEAVTLVVNGYIQLLELERAILSLSGDVDDEGTNSMVSDFISEQEKVLWMLTSWLG